MPSNQKKVIEIIMEQTNAIHEQGIGYRNELVELIADILELERLSKISSMQIQSEINEKIMDSSRNLVDDLNHNETEIQNEGGES